MPESELLIAIGGLTAVGFLILELMLPAESTGQLIATTGAVVGLGLCLCGLIGCVLEQSA